MVRKTTRNKRFRLTDRQDEELCQAVYEIAEAFHPLTVRSDFYQVLSWGLEHMALPKTENGYDMVQYRVLTLRRSGDIPWDWIVDGTRRVQKFPVYANPQAALAELIADYRRDPWLDQPVHTEVWGEKDAISSTVLPETVGLDVGLYITRGFTSDTFVQLTAAKEIAVINKPTMIYSLIDYDKAGGHIEDTMIAKLRQHAPNVEIEIKRLAVYAEQIAEYDLNTRPPKSQAEIDAGYSECVEVDAIRPDILRTLVRDAVSSQIDLKIAKRAGSAQKRDLKWLRSLKPSSDTRQ